MANTLSRTNRWANYRPSKGVWFWSSVGCVVATMVIGFGWGGWVTGGSAARMASDAASGSRAQLAAASCVVRFNSGPEAIERPAALHHRRWCCQA